MGASSTDPIRRVLSDCNFHAAADASDVCECVHGYRIPCTWLMVLGCASIKCPASDAARRPPLTLNLRRKPQTLNLTTLNPSILNRYP